MQAETDELPGGDVIPLGHDVHDEEEPPIEKVLDGHVIQISL